MKVTIVDRVSRAVVLFVALAGFLFGQAYNGIFDLPGTLAGTGGVLAGGLMAFASRPALRHIGLAGCAIGLVGTGMHVFDYYSQPRLSGAYYPWFVTLPYGTGLVLIAARFFSAGGLVVDRPR